MLKLRNKNTITLDVLSVDIDIVNGISAVCNTPMFAAQTVKPYYYGEHSCHMNDYIKENFDELIEMFSKDKLGRPDSRISLLDLKKSEILLFSLMHYMAYPFLLASIENFESFHVNNSRLLGAFFRGVGFCYDDYLKCMKLIKYVDKQIKKDIDNEYYNKDAKYMYYEPLDVAQMFISRFNDVAPFSLYLLNQREVENHLLRYLPTIKMK